MKLEEKFIMDENYEYVENLLNQVIKDGLNFKRKNSTLPQKMPEEKWMELELGSDGTSNEELIRMFEEQILPACSNFSNTGFMGFPDAGNSISGILGSVFADMLQQNLINESFCAPVATRMEMQLITALRKMMGYEIKKNIKEISDIGGIITYGGTGSNTTAMMLARENRKLNALDEGVKNPEKYKVIIPKNIGHYSIRSSLKWIGCGDQIIEVETENFRYNLSELEKTLKREAGNIMAVVVYAGDSRTMTIEHLDEVVNLVKKVDSTIWCHADACHGFSLMFSDNYKYKMKGIDKYDSISCDPHKVLALPYCCSALLLKNENNFQLISSNSDLIMNESFAFGQITPFIGSKSWVSLKLWFVMKSLGTKGIGEMIDRRIEMANYFANVIKENPDFVLINQVDFNSVVFVYVGKETDRERINAINKRIYEKMKFEGKFYLHQFPLIDDCKVLEGGMYNVLRYMSGNMNLKKDKIDECIKYLKRLAEDAKNEFVIR